MKHFALITLSLIMVAISGMAQPGQRNMNPEDMAKRQTAQLKEAVGLNDKQEKQVYDLNLESSKKMQAMRQSQSGNVDGMREKMMAMRAEQDKKMKSILTDAQWKKYEKYQEERREQRGQGGPGSNRR